MSGPAETIFGWLMLTVASGAALAAMIFIIVTAAFTFYFVKSIIDTAILELHRSRNARQTRKSKVRRD